MLHVSSETGRLRRALVHAPGAEIDRMVPAMMEELLFDDILYGERAREEFGRLRRVLQLLGVEVVEASDLLVEALADEGARTWVLESALRDLAPNARAELGALSPEALGDLLVTGQRRETARGGITAQELFSVPPLPNWCFQRDPQVVLHESVVFCSMASAARHREALLARAMFRFHPGLAATPVVHDPIDAASHGTLFVEPEVPHLEGGDVLVLSPEVLAVGLSERTNRIGLQQLARALSRRGRGPRWLVGVEVPRRRAYMHLDTLITLVDRDACLLHAPVLLPGGAEPAAVFEIDLEADDPTPVPVPDLLHCLARRGVDLEPIPCGGNDSVAQQREQWTDGANALAVAPGTILLYDRNVATVEELARRGFRVVTAKDLLLGREEIDLDEDRRVCVLLASHEMSRARGGPHCLVHPLERDPL